MTANSHITLGIGFIHDMSWYMFLKQKQTSEGTFELPGSLHTEVAIKYPSKLHEGWLILCKSSCVKDV